jgi:predicted ATPase
MLDSIVISNYRSLGPDVHIALGPLTVLVGPNGSGKSNILDALDFLSDAMRTGLDAALAKRDGIGAVQRWSAGRPFDVTLRVHYSDERYLGHYTVTLGSRRGMFTVKEEQAVAIPVSDADAEGSFFTVRGGKVTSTGLGLRERVETDRLLLPVASLDEGLSRLYDALRSTTIYSIFPDVLQKPSPPDPTRPMRPHGQNWTTALRDVLAGPYADEFRAGLAALTGDITEARVQTFAGYVAAEFKHRPESSTDVPARREKWLGAAQESAGTLRFAGILTALLQDPLPALVGLEEPEMTIHTGALRLLFDYISAASLRTQVVVTTHSPDLLDWLDPDDIRVVERVGGITRAGRMAEAQKTLVREKLMTLGDVARMEGLKTEESMLPSPAGSGTLVPEE